MTLYVGLDVSDKTTHICVVDGEGKVLRHDGVASDPDVLAKWLKRRCAGVALARVAPARGRGSKPQSETRNAPRTESPPHARG